MKCTEIKELLVAYVEGLLEDSEQQVVEEHLKDCSACRAELQELKNLQDRLETNGKALAQSNLEKDVMNQVIREQNTRLKAASRATQALKIRRTIMKSPVTKIAVAAAVIIIAVLIGINPFGNTVTWAQVIEPILNARTVIFDLIIGSEDSGMVSHEIVVGSRIRRTMSNMPNMTLIIDMDDSKMLGLDTVGKTAIYTDISGDLGDMTRCYIKFVRQIISQLQEGQVEQLGEQEIDGQKAVLFVGKGHNEEVKIWADPKTACPIRVEAQIGQDYSFVMKDFEFDADVDESLVSMEVPAGYTQKKNDIALGNATEEDFVESLKIWAKIIGDGKFPDAIGTEATMQQMPTLVQKVTAMQVSEEEGTKIGMSFAKGMLFHQMLDNQGRDWNYAGSGVKLGDASKPVFWYRPQGSDTYRVIYGDLSVKDVSPEDLPK
jgi:hypothetical protein